MSNYSLTWKNCNDVLAQRARTSGWAIAIGAGTSRQAFPDWEKLVLSLIRSDPVAADPNSLLHALHKSYSYDALIQAAKDVLNESDELFVQRLTELL